MLRGRKYGGMLLAGLISGGVAMVAIAQDAAIEKRTSLMKSQGGYFKTLNQTAKGELPFSPDTVKAAEGVVGTSKQVAAVFKTGAPGKGSAAKPEIWSDWADFEKHAKELEAAAPQLVAAAQSSDAAKLGDANKAVGAACGGCHKAYKAEKKQE
jgi:cytochrome c556